MKVFWNTKWKQNKKNPTHFVIFKDKFHHIICEHEQYFQIKLTFGYYWQKNKIK